MNFARLFVLAALVVLSASPAKGGFTSTPDGNAGTPIPAPVLGSPSSSNTSAVAAAVALLRSQGYTSAADKLDALFKGNCICLETGSAKGSAGGWSLPTCNPSPQGGKINLDQISIDNGPAVLAGVLLHELLHYVWHHFDATHSAGGTLPYEELHCRILWKEYKFNKEICAANPAPVGLTATDVANACRRKDQLQGLYPSFANHSLTSTSFPPYSGPARARRTRGFPRRALTANDTIQSGLVVNSTDTLTT